MEQRHIESSEIFPRPRAVTFATDQVAPPAPAYVSSIDRLVLTLFNSVPNLTILLAGRFMHPGGEITEFQFPVRPTSDRLINDFPFALAEGFLLSAVAGTASTPARRGQCYAVLSLIRDVGANERVLMQLAAGYIATGNALAWPGGPQINSVEGPGVMRSITGTAPAAGAEISETVPTGARWEIQSLFLTLTTSANVAVRTLELTIDDGATTLYRIASNLTQAASNVFSYLASSAPYLITTLTFRGQIPTPSKLQMMAGWRIRTATANLQVNDQYAAMQMAVQEQIEA